MNEASEPPGLDETTKLVMPRGVRLREDPERGWILLAPERVMALDPVAIAVLQEIDGEKTFGDIIDALASKYNAPRPQIAGDARLFLEDLMAKRVIESRA